MYCGDRIARKALVIPNLVIVVEVLSPTTAHVDTSAKLIGYFSLPSVEHYLVLDPDTHAITHHTRSANGTIANIVADGTLRLEPSGHRLEGR